MTTILSIAILATMAVAHLVLRYYDRPFSDLFQTTSGTWQSALLRFVICIQLVAGVTSLLFRSTLFGEPVMYWALLFYLAFVWLRVFMIVRSRRRTA